MRGGESGSQLPEEEDWLRATIARLPLPPHPPRDVFLLRPGGIGVDGGDGELSVAEPPLRQVEGDAGGGDAWA